MIPAGKLRSDPTADCRRRWRFAESGEVNGNVVILSAGRRIRRVKQENRSIEWGPSLCSEALKKSRGVILIGAKDLVPCG